MAKNKNLTVIYGCGGHSRDVADVILYNNPDEQLLFVDKNAREGEIILGFSVTKKISIDNYRCIVAIGNNMERKKKYDELCKEKLISVVSKNAYKGYRCTIGNGCYVGHFCMIGPEVIIGENSLISYASCIGHETEIGRHCFVGPNASIAGRTKLGDLVYLGAGATVIDKVQICSNAIIGAGATVVEDIFVPGTYVGTPARRIK